jgi:hypothetical protein
MKPRLPIVLAFAGLVGSGIALTANAQQQQQPPAPPAATQMPQQPTRLAPDDRAALLEARIAALRAGLTLTPDQERLWPPVETALRDTARTMLDQIQRLREEGRPSDPIERLRRVGDAASARGAAFRKLADAAGPLYSSLNESQRHRVPLLVRGIRGSVVAERLAELRDRRGEAFADLRDQRAERLAELRDRLRERAELRDLLRERIAGRIGERLGFEDHRSIAGGERDLTFGAWGPGYFDIEELQGPGMEELEEIYGGYQR